MISFLGDVLLGLTNKKNKRMLIFKCVFCFVPIIIIIAGTERVLVLAEGLLLAAASYVASSHRYCPSKWFKRAMAGA